MKYFIFSMISSKQQNNGGRKQVVAVYQIKRNRPVFLGEITWNTAAYCGDKAEVQQFLIEKKLAPKKLGNYYSHNNTNIVIEEV